MRNSLSSLRNLLAAAIGTTSVKSYLIGKSDEPKTSDLPQVQIYPETTTIRISGTAKDEHRRVIKIRVIGNVKNYLKQESGAISTISSVLAIADLMEKKVTDGSISSASIIGVLRTTPTIGGHALYTDEIEANYSALGDLSFPNVAAEVSVVLIDRRLTKS